MTTFEELGVSREVVESLSKMNFQSPTGIQTETIWNTNRRYCKKK